MYKEECVLKNKIFHPSVMYYILSTIVYPLSPTYPINLKSETMHKITLNVPEGIRYLSDWHDLWNTLLPEGQHYILNKRICGCGATEAYLRSGRKVILASPRKHLLYNKYSQHLSDNLHLYRYQGDKKRYFESRLISPTDTFSNKKLPSKSVIVPFTVPLEETILAPIMGSFNWSFTTPDTEKRSCANA